MLELLQPHTGYASLIGGLFTIELFPVSMACMDIIPGLGLESPQQESEHHDLGWFLAPFVIAIYVMDGGWARTATT
jgi:hypothetical protein